MKNKDKRGREGERKKLEDRGRVRLLDTYYNKYESQEGRKDILQIKISYLHEWIFYRKDNYTTDSQITVYNKIKHIQV